MSAILIIEDEHALASALAAACRRLGYGARLCASGARGLEEAAREKWAAILLDIGLPDVNGLTVLEQLLAHDRTRP
ncbi:MAG TPA: response regulator, partial [Chthoniobacteraceae bacterium]|nr:response regulator [Chthoniobacteraceae bacterium]